MSLFNTIKRNLPSLRRPKRDSLYELFLNEYAWSFMSSNKPAGELEVYYNALNNVYVSRCIEVYCDESLNNGFSINNPNSEVVNYASVNYLNGLFNFPEGRQSEATFPILNSQIWTSWLATGDCFIEVNHDKIADNVPNGFRFIPTELIGYDTEVNQWTLRNTGYHYENDEIIHIYKPPVRAKNIRWGTSIIDSIGLSIALEFLGMKHNKDIFEHSGVDPLGVMSFDSETPKGAVDANINRLKAMKEKKGIIAIQGGTYQRISSTNRDMDFASLLNYARDRILTGFGVQPAKLSIRETASLGSGTGESQDKDFSKTLAGKCKIIEGAFNRILGHGGFEEVFNYNKLDTENKETRANIEDKQLKNGSTYINEVRAGYGLAPVDWGNAPLNYSQYALANSPNDMNELESLEVKSLQKALLYERLSKEY
ncbi:phage portal protein [uncultured Methanobrevibacter sp.]|uniref:phage portal protein n=1 Tax=uncultured Methanobrevibacter sp. TaxID=253161 RepID=UPI0026258BE7|nr:phage portal protein [uncultured Methanobrevibacter sp.]